MRSYLGSFGWRIRLGDLLAKVEMSRSLTSILEGVAFDLRRRMPRFVLWRGFRVWKRGPWDRAGLV